jgi:hypothetical protein
MSRMGALAIGLLIVIGGVGIYYLSASGASGQKGAPSTSISSGTSSLSSSTTGTFTSSALSSSFTSISASGGTTEGSFSYSAWGNLRGSAYRWRPLAPDTPPSPSPDESFPMMKSLGFNLARIPADWKLLDQNASMSTLWTQVASTADANGIYCIWIFGGDYNSMPLSLVSQYSSESAFYIAWWSDGVVPSGQYAGITLWEAEFQGLWKPLVQDVGSHPSTIGLTLWNEPSGLPSSGPFGDPLHTLHAYYEYETQRIRTLSDIAVGFQATSNGGGSSTSIPIVAPTSDLKPYYFEGHMYSYNSTMLSDWALGASEASAMGYIGETHDLTLAFYQQIHSQGWAITWFSWTCGGGTDLLSSQTPTVTSTCQPDSDALQLSQDYTQVWGPL